MLPRSLAAPQFLGLLAWSTGSFPVTWVCKRHLCVLPMNALFSFSFSEFLSIAPSWFQRHLYPRHAAMFLVCVIPYLVCLSVSVFLLAFLYCELFEGRDCITFIFVPPVLVIVQDMVNVGLKMNDSRHSYFLNWNQVPDAGKDGRQKEKGVTEDEMVGWHHHLNGHEFDWTLGGSEGQGSLACCSPWGRKESSRLSDWTTITKKYLLDLLESAAGWELRIFFIKLALPCSHFGFFLLFDSFLGILVRQEGGRARPFKERQLLRTWHKLVRIS